MQRMTSDAESASWGQEAAKSQKLENFGVQIPRARCPRSGAFGPFFSPEGGPPFGGGPKCQHKCTLRSIGAKYFEPSVIFVHTESLHSFNVQNYNMKDVCWVFVSGDVQ